MGEAMGFKLPEFLFDTIQDWYQYNSECFLDWGWDIYHPVPGVGLNI